MKKKLLILCALLMASCSAQTDNCCDLLNRYENHDPSAYGLSNIKETGLRLETSDIQRLWESLGVDKSRQHFVGRSWYAPTEEDLNKFLVRAVSHRGQPAVDYHCGDYATALMGERMAMGLWGSCQLESHLMIVGMIQGELNTIDGPASHAWNWAIKRENPDKILFIDYLKPPANTPFNDVTEITNTYFYDPDLQGEIVNPTVTW